MCSGQHGRSVERLDRKLALHVQPTIVEADDRDIVPCLMVGEGELAAGAVLGPQIRHVAGMAVEEKMVRVYAERLVAAMADIHAFRNRPVPDDP